MTVIMALGAVMADSQRPWSSRRLGPKQVSELVIASRDGERITVVFETGDLIEAPNWTPDGASLIYNADGRLWRISVDGRIGPERIDTTPVENLNNDHVLSPDGTLIYVTSNDGHIYVLPIAGGVPERVTNEHPEGYRHYLHGVSPDGKTLAYVRLRRSGDGVQTWIATIPAAGGEDTILTDGACPVDGPEFSADGASVYFNSEAAATRPGHAQIFRCRPDGAGLEQLTHDDRVNWFPHAAPDGTIFSYISFPPGTEGHPPDRDVILRTMAPDGSDIRDLDVFNGGQGTINVPSWSPGSDRLAYVRYPQRD
ncbi:TolB family protein [Flavimaricola marinus]|uniref:Translocation protein TolB n=1 Tax=Flavimaricola marinus TaxID=1819565 RepID=A0A238LKB6_9RHOB|nr:PD40 domain-containing protein [Flavimaricola marinus]SMY09396.1 translocation protein TolB [Flavimaricola marinus]